MHTANLRIREPVYGFGSHTGRSGESFTRGQYFKKCSTADAELASWAKGTWARMWDEVSDASNLPAERSPKTLVYVHMPFPGSKPTPECRQRRSRFEMVVHANIADPGAIPQWHSDIHTRADILAYADA